MAAALADLHVHTAHIWALGLVIATAHLRALAAASVGNAWPSCGLTDQYLTDDLHLLFSTCCLATDAMQLPHWPAVSDSLIARMTPQCRSPLSTGALSCLGMCGDTASFDARCMLQPVLCVDTHTFGLNQ